MANLTVNIPHQLGRDEAKRRIEDQITNLLSSPSVPMTVEHAWQGDTLNFRLTAAGQSFPGNVFVEDQVVRVEIELPWILATLGNALKVRIGQQGQKLLGQPNK